MADQVFAFVVHIFENGEYLKTLPLALEPSRAHAVATEYVDGKQGVTAHVQRVDITTAVERASNDRPVHADDISPDNRELQLV